MGAQVANGWYSGHIGNGGFQYWGKSPALLAQLEVVYQDGSIERIVTDRSWKSHVSPMLSSDFMHGEEYDARNEMPGWDRPGYNAEDRYSVRLGFYLDGKFQMHTARTKSFPTLALAKIYMMRLI